MHDARVDGTLFILARTFLPATAIRIRKHRISSDLRSEPDVGAISTGVGDHLGILRVVVFVLLVSLIIVFLLKDLNLFPYQCLIPHGIIDAYGPTPVKGRPSINGFLTSIGKDHGTSMDSVNVHSDHPNHSNQNPLNTAKVTLTAVA